MTSPWPGAVAGAPITGGRALGVDLGSVRIGLALSDPTRTVATPLVVLQRAKNDVKADHHAIVKIAREHPGDVVVAV